ncbi:MAG TPA: Trm112 family protein [Pusillimonas sp.]|uniref:Trm112 family protein n=1 Tax=Pusillimonas sp. TaxID=3040095 RepID=UPI002C21279D|nr:Trm112 family protein [Pusillimonas sp.]HUH86832.1 Trm112 family protein [Pusillimonas sp.]
MESHLLDILVCPLCKGPLHYDRQAQELTCKADKLAFPIRDGIPVMLESEARSLVGGDTPSSTATHSPAAETTQPDPQA